jgi:hypothetical protein
MDYLLLKYAHIIAFVYWLGGDLGTFIASNYVVKRDISAESRGIALKIMLACDQGPKLAMPLMLVLGIHMATMIGMLPMPTWALAAVWVVGLYWFGVVLVLYFNQGKAFTQKIMQVDFYFRIVVVVGLIAWAVMGLLDNSIIAANWVAYKIIIFSLLVSCGIFIRINLRPFVPAFIRLMTEGANDEINDTLQNSVSRCRPFVWTIWAGLFVSAALGVHLI